MSQNWSDCSRSQFQSESSSSNFWKDSQSDANFWKDDQCSNKIYNNSFCNTKLQVKHLQVRHLFYQNQHCQVNQYYNANSLSGSLSNYSQHYCSKKNGNAYNQKQNIFYNQQSPIISNSNRQQNKFTHDPQNTMNASNAFRKSNNACIQDIQDNNNHNYDKFQKTAIRGKGYEQKTPKYYAQDKKQNKSQNRQIIIPVTPVNKLQKFNPDSVNLKSKQIIQWSGKSNTSAYLYQQQRKDLHKKLQNGQIESYKRFRIQQQNDGTAKYVHQFTKAQIQDGITKIKTVRQEISNKGKVHQQELFQYAKQVQCCSLLTAIKKWL